MVHVLEEHLFNLEHQRSRMDRLIDTVRKTLASVKGEYVMSDEEKFAVFKEKLVKENEEQYGEEIRKKWGDGPVDESNRKVLNMSEQDWEHFKNLEQEIRERLEKSVNSGIRADSQEAEAIVALHREWLSMSWSQYTSEAHKSMGVMYTCDERFRKYYDEHVPGCAEFLRQAIDYHA
ncbi:TipAS antibiotic-recognition domain-containing protein [Lachnospiraceae bacterium KK002]